MSSVFVRRRKVSLCREVAGQHHPSPPRMECFKQVVREEEYSVVGTIGKGSFGSVLLVEERNTSSK